jgi:hypothetical protein
MDAAIIEQPDSDLLGSFDGRVCEEVTELEMFRSAEKLIIQEKSQRLGGMIIYYIFCLYTYANRSITIRLKLKW